MIRKLALACRRFASSSPSAPAALAGSSRTAADPGVTDDLDPARRRRRRSPARRPPTPRSPAARTRTSSTSTRRAACNGRKITYKYVDDAYNPAQTVQATRKLVEQDKVFAIFNALGTEHNDATRDYLNANKVPQLFVASGATKFGPRRRKYPYTIGFQPSYQAEGWVLRQVPRAHAGRGAKVAVIFQNDDYGKDLLNGLKRGIQRSKVKVVAAEPYEVTAADVQAQVAKLKASGADTFAIFATPKFAIQSYVFANRLGWKPKLRHQQRRLVGLEHDDARLRGRHEQGRRTARSRSSSSRIRPIPSGRTTRR